MNNSAICKWVVGVVLGAATDMWTQLLEGICMKIISKGQKDEFSDYVYTNALESLLLPLFYSDSNYYFLASI